MKYSSNKPIYLQISYRIVLDIYEKKIKLGTLLPSVRELSATYSVTPKTIQSVTSYLAENEIIYKKPSVGSVITTDYEKVSILHMKHGMDNTLEYITQMTSLSYSDEEIKNMINDLLGGRHDKN